MIKDEAIAKSVLDLMNRSHSLLVDSLRLVEAKCSDKEYTAFQSEMAQVLGQLFFLVMEPIYRAHPSLAPLDTPRDFLDRWHKNSD
ncbi:MAG TPA: hypothetical protein VI685_29695, partial [Candidatus Angelobacter sp.]